MDEPAKPRRGRPPTGVTPKRDVRIGAVWDEVEAIIGKGKMPARITRLLEQELRRLRRAAASSASQEKSQGDS